MRRLFPEPGEVPDDLALAEAYRLPPGRTLRMDFIAALDGSIAVEGRSARDVAEGYLKSRKLLK